MKMIKNEEMEYIPVDENCVVLFDPTLNKTHFFEGTAAEIVRRIYCGENDLDKLIESLEQEYNDPDQHLRQDVEAFAVELEEIKAVRQL